MVEDAKRRLVWRQWLMELTSLPTATGRERRVIEWIRRWAADRPDAEIVTDDAGNMMLQRPRSAARSAHEGTGPILLTGHLDHPAFVIDEVGAGGRVATARFLGGVREPYFIEGRVTAHSMTDDRAIPVSGTITLHTEADPPRRLFRVCEFSFDDPIAWLRAGDIAVWELPETSISLGDGLVRARVCDDLAAVCAALGAFDTLGGIDPQPDVRVLLTLAEEVGFIGAIAACRLGTIPPGSRVIALENSRSFADSPIGAGPIVRVGDRMTTFSPTLTAAVAKVCEKLAGTGDRPVGTPVPASEPQGGFRWQRKLMPGGACEATAYCAYGHEATCVCLPLGNYHNMADLDEVEKPGYVGAARVGPEVIALSDFEMLIDLLIACGTELGATEPMTVRLEKLYDERSFVLEP
jgi:endoglucanase